MNYRILVLLFFCLPVSAQIVGSTLYPQLEQHGFKYQTDDRHRDTSDAGETFFHAAEKKLEGGVYDHHADELLAAARNFTTTIFHLPSLEFLDAATRWEDGDVLIAKWTIDETFAKGVVILEDSPFWSKYYFRVRADEIYAKDALTKFLTNLVAWREAPTNFTPERVTITAATDGPSFNSFSMTVDPLSQFRYRDFNFFSTRSQEGGERYMYAYVGKWYTKSIYPVPPYIPERFPPLSELLPQWSFAKIWSEVGKQVGPLPGEEYLGFRDTPLIAELFRRGVTEEQFGELLRNPYGGYQTRERNVMEALENAGKMALLPQYFEAGMDAFQKIGIAADDAVIDLFRIAARACAPEFERVAGKVLKGGVFTQGPLNYLSTCRNSTEGKNERGPDKHPIPQI